MDDTLKAASAAASILDEMGVRWFLGGSLASSVHGIPRATFDADIMADLRPQQVKPFLQRLGDAWYAGEGAIMQAMQARSAFNLIHFDTAMKVDVFLPKLRRFDGGEFARSRKMLVAEGSDVEASVCCAEDIVIAKLEWYRLGGEYSQRQWSDSSVCCDSMRANSISNCCAPAPKRSATLNSSKRQSKSLWFNF